MRVSITGLCLLLGLLFACKPTPLDRYRQVAAEGERRGYASVTDALAGEAPIREWTAGDPLELRLTVTDPILKLQDSAVEYYANFQLLALPPSARGLRVRALCDCLGARKQLVLPRLLWADPAGGVRYLEPTGQEIREPDMALPIHLYQEYEWPISGAPGLLLLHADNRPLGEVFVRSTNPTVVYLDPGYLDIEVPYEVKVSPVGRVRVEVW